MSESKTQLKEKKKNKLTLAKQMKRKKNRRKSQRDSRKMKDWQVDNRPKHQVKNNVQVLMCSVWGNGRKPKVGLS